MISYLFVALAAVFNAVMDRVEYPAAFNQSIFKNKNPRFWLKSTSWEYAKKIGSYKFDAWHIAKSSMIFCFAFAIAFMDMSHWWVVKFVTVGGVWIVTFNLFYNKILVSREGNKGA